MADPTPETRGVTSELDEVRWPPPGVTQADAAFLVCLWYDLRASGSTSFSDIQTQIENALRAKPEVPGGADSYKQALQRLLVRHPDLAERVQRYAQHDDFSADHRRGEQHFLWVLPQPWPISWRIYLSPTPATAPELVASLSQRLSGRKVAGVGMKLSTHEALCRLRDGVVLYAEDDAGRDAALNAISDEATAHPERFSRTLVRFTRPVAGGFAGLGPEPFSLVNDLSKHHLPAWFNNNRDWLDSQKLDWSGDDRGIPSYTQFVASVLTTCYLLGEAPKSRVVRARRGQPSQVEGAAFKANVYEAFTEMSFNPSQATFGPATEAGVGWLRFWLFG